MSVGIDAIHLNGKIGNQVDEVQQRRLGEDVYFPATDSYWTYVEFKDVAQRGEHARDAVTADLVGTALGAVTAIAAVDSKKLNDTGAFANKDLRGAIGQITAGPGVGQTFYIKDNDDADNVIIELLAELQGIPELDEEGWRVQLTTASRYQLRQPGVVYRGGAVADFTRGLYQQDITADMLNKYGYVLRWGLGFGRILLSDTETPSIGEPLIAAANGLLEGGVATVAELSKVIATAQLGDLTTSANTEEALIPVEVRVPTTIRSYYNPEQMKDPRSYTALGR